MATATEQLIRQARNEAVRAPLSDGERFVLSTFLRGAVAAPPLGGTLDDVKPLSELIGDGASFYLAPGEFWSDAANDDISRLDAVSRERWTALLQHALAATTARPSARWLSRARTLVDAIGADQVRQALERWFPAVTRGQSIRKLAGYLSDTRGAADVMNEENANCLRGLLWLVQTLPHPDELARPITSVALSAYKKVPGVGPRGEGRQRGRLRALRDALDRRRRPARDAQGARQVRDRAEGDREGVQHGGRGARTAPRPDRGDGRAVVWPGGSRPAAAKPSATTAPS